MQRLKHCEAWQREMAPASIDAGADRLFGHGPHGTRPIGFYRDRAIFYGVGGSSLAIRLRARRHTDATPTVLGIMVEVISQDAQTADRHLQFVRHDAANETALHSAADEAHSLADLRATRCAAQRGTAHCR